VDVSDQYAEKSSLWPKILIVLFFAWWIHSYFDYEGWFYRWTDGKYGKQTPEIQKLIDERKEAAKKAEAAKAEADAKAAADAAAAVKPAAP
jgi:hypothetical protein